MANIFERMANQGTKALLAKAPISPKIMKYTSAAGDLASGKYANAAKKLLGGSKLFGGLFDPGGAFSSNDNIVLAGVSWAKLEEMFDEAQGVSRERSNLWHVAVDPIGRISAPRVNLLAIEASYNGVQLGYDPVKIGSGFTMSPTGAEAVELRLVCYDVDGEIKLWFDQLRATAARPDGTFGVPSDYANTITITHGAIQEGYGYAASWAMVPVSCEVNLSRSTDEFTALNLAFTQFDYFGGL